MLSATDISRGLGTSLTGRKGSADPSRLFSRVVIDSRQVQEGDLFIALPGKRRDGHHYLGHAIAQGATGAIVSRPIGDFPRSVCFFQVRDTLVALQQLASNWLSQHIVHVIGVTGSIGKTTCKEIIGRVLEHRYSTLRSEANYNTDIGLPLSILNLTQKQRWAVFEMGMHGRGEIARLCEIAKPEIGVVTNIYPIHLERLGSVEAIADAKAELVNALPPTGLALLNGDDHWTDRLATYSRAPVMLYGRGEQCELRATNVASQGLQGIAFQLNYRNDSVAVTTSFPGQHHVYPALAAVGVALFGGFTLQETAAALAAARPSLRLRVLKGISGSTILDDTYNAGPASMLAALDLLSEMEGRRLAFLGDMLELGDVDEEEHRRLGEAAAIRCDGLFAVGERAPLITSSAKRAGLAKAEHFETKRAATTALTQELKAGDHLLVKASRALGLETVVQALRSS